MKGLWRIALVIAAVLALGGTAVGFVAAQSEDEGVTAQHERGDFVALLAENLGVTQEELHAAIQQTQLDMVEEALSSGKITEEQAAQMRERIESGEGLSFGPGRGRPGEGRPGHDGPGRPGGCQPFRGVDQVAELLGLTVGEIVSELEQGMSLAQIAEANGVTAAELAATLLAGIEEHVAQAVADGKIDEARAEEILANAAEKIDMLINHEGSVSCQRPYRPQHEGGFASPTDGDAAPSPSFNEL